MKVKPSTSRRSSDAYHPYPPPAFAEPDLPHRPPSSASASAPTPTQDEQQYKVARAISSCTRCRQRKQKCDGKLPACTACERAKVECIGFDAISKTNISRNYLHSLEQEVAALRAQIQSLSSGHGGSGSGSGSSSVHGHGHGHPHGQADYIGNTKRDIAHSASQAVASFRPEYPPTPLSISTGIPIDPSLTSGHEYDPPMRSPWDSSPRRGSEHLALGSPHEHSQYAHGHHGRSGSIGGTSTHVNSLTRLVHDAALRTGHASNSHSTLNQAISNASGSEKGSTTDSPIGVVGIDLPLPERPSSTDQTHNAAQLPTPKSTIGSSVKSATGNSASPHTSSSGNGKAKRPFAIPPLPPQPAVERLVAAYVDFVGVTAPIIHVPTLGKQLIKIREGGNDVEQSDVFIVMMMLALSTMASARFVDPPDELRACSEAFHAEAMKHLDAVFEEQSYIGLQAILLLVWYSFLNPEKGSVWFLVGLATRTCVDLGFHNEHNVQLDQLDSLEIDMRRRLFWVTYKLDRLLSQSLGRPPAIPDGFINVPMPSHLHDVDIHPDHYGPLEGEACSYKAVFIHTTKLRQLQSEILNNTYGTMNTSPPAEEWFDEMFERLKEWLATSPDPRGAVSTEGYAISFHNSALLLYRPSPGCPRPGRKALATVLASSSYNIRIYRRMQLSNRISWLWMTSHFTFMAGLSFLYSFFNLYTTGGGQGVPTVEEAMMDIESCMAVLEYLTPRVPSAGACHDTMQAVSSTILDQIQKLDPPPRDAPSSSRTPDGRTILRGAPISSSRNDPLPHDAFPTPLPNIPLPYELTLLDNLFVNPMVKHNKASDYTCGSKNRLANQIQGHAQSHNVHPHMQKRSNDNSNGPIYTNPTQFNTLVSSTPHPQSLPPGAFHTSTAGSMNFGSGTGAGNTFNQLPQTSNGLGNGNNFGLGAYGVAAQVANHAQAHGQIDPNNLFALQTPGGGSISLPGQGSNNAGGDGTGNASGSGTNGNGNINGEEGQFDVFSFLMDDDAGLGNGWDSLEVPSDFSLWT